MSFIRAVAGTSFLHPKKSFHYHCCALSCAALQDRIPHIASQTEAACCQGHIDPLGPCCTPNPCTPLTILARGQSLIPHAAHLIVLLWPSSGLGLLLRGPSPTLMSPSEIPGLRHAVSSLLFAVRWVLPPLESDACCFCVRLKLLAWC